MTILYPLLPGLMAVTGGEGSGKTSLLRRLSGDLPALSGETPHPDALWLDLGLPKHDAQTPNEVWDSLQKRCSNWNSALHQDLTDALCLRPHLGKQLFMLSTGSRRKVALVGLLASGRTVTCLDQPYAALDFPSIRIIREFLNDMAEHPTHTWIVADYDADPQLPWRQVILLD